MCLYSLSSNAQTRKAKVAENMTLGEFLGHRCFMSDADGMVACIKPGTIVEIARIGIDTSRMGSAPTVNQPGRNGWEYVPKSKITKWNGKAGVRGTFVTWHQHTEYAADAIKLEDGTTIHMGWLREGTTMRIPRKVRSDKGTKKPRNLDRVLGLDQIKADIPVTGKVTA